MWPHLWPGIWSTKSTKHTERCDCRSEVKWLQLPTLVNPCQLQGGLKSRIPVLVQPAMKLESPECVGYSLKDIKGKSVMGVEKSLGGKEGFDK